MSDAGREERGFGFLFRTDRGTVSRATWWRGTVPIAILGLGAVFVWLLVRPYTENGLEQPPLAVLGAYLYLLGLSFGLVLLFVCEYNLSAKRFTACGRPRALAAVLPLSLLLAAAYAWILPRVSGAVPPWTAWIVAAAVGAVVVWNVVELGIRDGR
jgi:hypothetical protein